MEGTEACLQLQAVGGVPPVTSNFDHKHGQPSRRYLLLRDDGAFYCAMMANSIAQSEPRRGTCMRTCCAPSAMKKLDRGKTSPKGAIETKRTVGTETKKSMPCSLPEWLRLCQSTMGPTMAELRGNSGGLTNQSRPETVKNIATFSRTTRPTQVGDC